MTFPAQRVVCLAALAAVAGLRLYSAEAVSEDKVKAAFLYNFAKFVDWPADTAATAGGPFTICTIGKDALRPTLDESVKDKTLNDRAVAVQHVDQSDLGKGCQVVFVAAGESRHAKALLEKLPQTGVLTVGDSSSFLKDGGIIEFVTEDNRMRFRISLAAAHRAGLNISSRLLALAADVQR